MLVASKTNAYLIVPYFAKLQSTPQVKKPGGGEDFSEDRPRL
jgi:hypothetical protein